MWQWISAGMYWGTPDEIWFKTDDDSLFRDSLVYFDLCGFEPVFLTENLAESGFSPNYISEHEAKYMALGVPIKFGIFRMGEPGPDFDPTRFRLTPGVRKEGLERVKARWERRSRTGQEQEGEKSSCEA